MDYPKFIVSNQKEDSISILIRVQVAPVFLLSFSQSSLSLPFEKVLLNVQLNRSSRFRVTGLFIFISDYQYLYCL